MCYSAKVVADYRAYVRLFGATVDIKQFYDCARRPNFDHPCRLNADQGWKAAS